MNIVKLSQMTTASTYLGAIVCALFTFIVGLLICNYTVPKWILVLMCIWYFTGFVTNIWMNSALSKLQDEDID
jgi:hypothetical protein